MQLTNRGLAVFGGVLLGNLEISFIERREVEFSWPGLLGDRQGITLAVIDVESYNLAFGGRVSLDAKAPW